MGRQLQRTGFSGTRQEKARRRLLQGHYKAGGPHAALADQASRVVVGGRRNAAADAPEAISVRPVPPVDQATAGALPAGMPGVDQKHGKTLQCGLVLDQASQFVILARWCRSA